VTNLLADSLVAMAIRVGRAVRGLWVCFHPAIESCRNGYSSRESSASLASESHWSAACVAMAIRVGRAVRERD